MAPLDARKSMFPDSREPDLRRVSQAETIRDFSAKPAAEAEESLVNKRGGNNVIVADARIARALGGVRAENGAQIRRTACVGVIVIESAGDTELFGKAVVNFDVVQIRRGVAKRALDDVVVQASVCRGK